MSRVLQVGEAAGYQAGKAGPWVWRPPGWQACTGQEAPWWAVGGEARPHIYTV